MSEKIAIMGPGAVGSYVGAFLAREGEDVTFIDMWPEHVETMRRQGLRASGSQGDFTVPVKAMHLTDAQGIQEPFDFAFITVKSYDTEWATHFIKRYVKPEGFFISLQNCWNDTVIGDIVGSDRQIGCIASHIEVALWEPGAPEAQRELSPYIHVASMVGKLLTDLAEGQFLGINVGYQGEIAQHDTAVLKAAVLAGFLGPVSSEHVNLINAPSLAQQRGLNVTEQRNPAAQEYASLLTATLETTEGGITLAGTSMRGEAHIVKVNEYWVDITPSVPYLLFVENDDQPGSIGAVATVTGRHNINISFMEVGRLSVRGMAMMVLGLDDPVPSPVLEEIKALPQIRSARLVRL